jgi:hypothetical protein
MKGTVVLATLGALLGIAASPAGAAIDKVQVRIAGYLCGF